MQTYNESSIRAAAELLRRRRARKSLAEFAGYVRTQYEANWHHRVIFEALDRLARGECKRLMVFAPPRHGKSEQVSRLLPAYLLGLNPDLQVIACSYAADLASRMNRDVQRLIDRPAYAALFPETKLAGKGGRRALPGQAQGQGTTYLRNNDLFEVVGRAGAYRSAGVLGGITGMGADVAVIDDPVKSAAEANSPVHREHVWEWFSNDLYTRLHMGGSLLLTLTRWHHDDLAGRLLRLAADDPGADKWEVLRFPALAEPDPPPYDPRREGEALWPARFPRETLEAARSQLGPHGFAALYQQRPVPREGGLFTLAGLSHMVPEAPARAVLRARYWDKGYSARGDFSAGVLMSKTMDGIFVIEDVVRVRLDPLERNRVIKATALADARRPGPRVRTYLERPPGAGAETTDALLRELAPLPCESVAPRGDKAERAEGLAAQCAAGNVLLVDGPWVRVFREELLGFPQSPNDDQADAAAGAFLALARPRPGAPAAGGAPPPHPLPSRYAAR